MLRAGTGATAPYYAVFVTPSAGVSVVERPTAGAATKTLAHLSGTVPAYLWVGTTGTTVTAYGSSDGYLWTSPVRTFASNRFGLYDMTGNVWEWTEDLIRGEDLGSPPCCTPAEVHYGEGDSSSARHVVKGGSYLCSENCQHYRPAARYGQPGRISACHIGFRCVVRSRAESRDG